jgi:hypothetical protein
VISGASAQYLARTEPNFSEDFIVDMVILYYPCRKSKQEVHYESLSRYPLLAGVSQPAFKKNTIKTYQSILSKLTTQFGERDLNSLTPEEVLSFLTDINQRAN